MSPAVLAPPAASAASAAPVLESAVRLSSTRRGARLARYLAVQQLERWGVPYTAPASVSVAAITAELAANAVTHGRMHDRDFRLCLVRAPRAVRVEVTDSWPDRLPLAAPQPPDPEATSGRGLLLVAALADRWGWHHGPAWAKTVWAEVDTAPTRPGRSEAPCFGRSPHS
ncbi:ATP-binding protein [Streptomyces sp. HB2AG]|uniref:ATP-binding protein n=1 Tax=Streptomyces sp. HB2AG TaxID=2983400 RepID=UPI0022AA2B03|nr:ATP-binding protein [Streptomyces sp. HB2AG]MCZ2526202.1 ATP-binding protein [Streptomyces sp. HB2AG]